MDYEQLVAAAQKRAENELNNQRQTEDDFAFAEVGEYIPSEAEQTQLKKLAAIQQKANATTFDSRIRF